MKVTMTYRLYEIDMRDMTLLAEADTYVGAINAMRDYYGHGYLDAHVLVMSAETFTAHDGIKAEFSEKPRAYVASDGFVAGWLAGRASAGKLNAQLEDIEAVDL